MERYSVSFKLILHAGNSKSKSAQSIAMSKQRKFKEAEILIEDAKEELMIAHNEQTKLITSELKNEGVNLNMLLVHAQDHISGAGIYIYMAEEVLDLRKEIFYIRKELNLNEDFVGLCRGNV